MKAILIHDTDDKKKDGNWNENLRIKKGFDSSFTDSFIQKINTQILIGLISQGLKPNGN